MDRSGFSVRLTLWGRQATDFNPPPKPIVAWKSVRVGDFGGEFGSCYCILRCLALIGRSLSMMSSSIMEVNPDIPEAHGLRGWYDAGGDTKEFKSQTTGPSSGGTAVFNRDEIRFLNDVREAELGMHGDKPEYFSSRGMIMHIRSENLAYPACQSEGCNKKVVQQHDGWRCEKCERSWEKPSYRSVS